MLKIVSTLVEVRSGIFFYIHLNVPFKIILAHMTQEQSVGGARTGEPRKKNLAYPNPSAAGAVQEKINSRYSLLPSYEEKSQAGTLHNPTLYLL